MPSNAQGTTLNTSISSTQPLLATHPNHPSESGTFTEEWEAQFPPPLDIESQVTIRRQECTDRLDARDRLRQCMIHALEHPSPKKFPTFIEISNAAKGATEHDLFRYNSNCATRICEAANACAADLPSASKDAEAAEFLSKKRESCRQPDSFENDKFVAQVPRDELVEMLRDVMADIAAFVFTTGTAGHTIRHVGGSPSGSDMRSEKRGDGSV